MQLNEQQKKVVEFMDGPCLVTAVPGSGKTASLVQRVIRLIERGVPEKNIVCLTFTNKAANEMKQRIAKALGKKPRCYIGTFHALCVLILRKYSHLLGYEGKFTIIDSSEQVDFIMQVARQGNVIIDKSQAYKIAKAVNTYRENMERFVFIEEFLQDEDMTWVGEEYLKKLKSKNLFDFTSLLSETARLFSEHEQVKDKIQEQFKYLQIDECQDTNIIQFHLLNLFTKKYNNIMLIGDQNQCVTGDTVVETLNGKKKIEDIQVGDEVLCAKGGGKSEYRHVLRKYESQVNRLIRVKTKSGYTLTSTPDHIYFADFRPEGEQKHFVYLMYREDKGYRVGISKSYKDNSNHGRMGYAQRNLGESADKVWVIHTCNSELDARYWEQYYAITYGLPTWTFKVHSNRANSYTAKYIQKLFDNIDTRMNVKSLCEDLWLNLDYPHHVPKCTNSKRRRNFSVTLCADSRGSTLHAYSVSGSDMNDSSVLIEAGLNARPAKKCRGWRVEGARTDLGSIQKLYKDISSKIDTNLIEKARFTSKALPFMPASNLHEGMFTFVNQNGEIVEDEIVAVEKIEAEEKVYDIDIERVHNFVGNSIVTHNSVYRFRGSRYQNIQDFIKMHVGCEIIELPLNYRSTPEIVKRADTLINNNFSHMGGEFITNNPNGEEVQTMFFSDGQDEARFIARQSKRLIETGGWSPGDIAILYRTNAMSEPIERAMSNEGLKYKVIGGRSFYDRKEIKDCLALLRFKLNPKDGIAFHRVASFSQGIGDTTIGRIENIAEEDDIDIISAIKKYADTKKNKVSESLHRIVSRFSEEKATAADTLNFLVNAFKYEEHLEKKHKDNCDERIENVNQLIDSVAIFGRDQEDTSIEKYLQMISLTTSSDKEHEKDCISLMTLHASKGLEYPIVFMAGVEDRVLPHVMSTREDPIEGVEEERRLCYVGMTRAEKLLYMTWCKRRSYYQRGGGGLTWKNCKPSQFLFESGLLNRKESYLWS